MYIFLVCLLYNHIQLKEIANTAQLKKNMMYYLAEC